ncbi:hypothetical protein A3A36_02775 [Candidatus Kaiserbacteria bacterium RIFCSPLOWO2_01_FULL_52_12b]|uniref:Uncharacterized protein n=1 Tax=Candidatus Kaiserbacteria bacterium RIFCSPLOWO2_01_FULL_52_12b TaxID=1798509 RepID=A0A1F6EWU2_9BACT|nr:MAG: hypothetical protein A3A36_02775 [Candidatus Kaiserbacteria bacterium RIFCSPLOWO2_01_FULL_52_12b]
MPQKRNSQEPPKVMTWGKAAPTLVIAAIFDVLRLMFMFFWFFGPALVGLYCTVKVGDVWVVGTLLAKGCVAGAAAIGIGGFAPIAAFGVIMAMAVGFAGWLTVGFILLIFNKRIFKENALWFVGSLLISEIPIVGSVPAITIVVRKMYSNQIKLEKAALKKYQDEQTATQLKEQQQQAVQRQAAQQAQAANDELYDQAQTANDEDYGIPDVVRKRA